MNVPIALPDETFYRLVDDLLHARDASRIMELIGGVANVWPESALPGFEAKGPDLIATTPELGECVRETATAPEPLAFNATGVLGHTPLAWPPARPRPMTRGAINPPWRTPG